jgi:electron transport complex protein RnfA
MSEFLAVLIGAALVNNLILALPLGSDALRAVRVGSLGPATALLILLAAPPAWMIQHWLLQPLQLQHLHWLLVVALVAPLTWLSLRLLARLQPNLSHEALWPLLLVNGAVLGSLQLAPAEDSLPHVLGLAIGGGLGFWLALQLLADLLQRVEACPVPALFKGAPVTLISTGLAGMALLGFSGLGGA